MLNWRYIKIQSVPQSKHSVSVIKTSQLMLYREIIAVCSQIHTKHINTLRRQNVQSVNVKPGSTNSNHSSVKGLKCPAVFFYVTFTHCRSFFPHRIFQLLLSRDY